MSQPVMHSFEPRAVYEEFYWGLRGNGAVSSPSSYFWFSFASLPTRYGLVGPEIECRRGARSSTTVQAGTGTYSASCVIDTESLYRG